MRILESGNIGIGTSTSSAPLTIRRSNTGNAFVVRNTGDTSDVFVIDSSGLITTGTWNGSTISVSYGGTGATTASGARTNLGAASSGVNTDITAIQGLNQQNAIQINPYGTSSGNTGEIRFLELSANGTNYVGFKAPNLIGNNVIWTLPNADGTSGQVLTTDGSGNLSWTTISGSGGIGGSISTGQVAFGTASNTIGGSNNLFWDNTNTRLGVGTNSPQNTLHVSGAARITGNLTLDTPLDFRSVDLSNIFRRPFIFTDFLGASGAATLEAHIPLDYVAISSGTTSKIAGEPSHPGIQRITSSTTANSGGYVLTDITAFRIGGGEVFEIVFRHLVASGTNTTIRMGFIDTTTSADAVDGVYFELANNLNLVGKTSNNSTRSTTGTSYTISTNTWYRARLVVNSNATQVDFYLFSESGTQLWTSSLTTNIPTASGRETGLGFIATNSGTTATALFDVDYLASWYTRDLTR
ncbi:MAG: hypothetical protein NZ484_00860 [Patescibacteria group bacterium]|nr:hypothetical protein [Patescibacteria group bacterium]